MVRKQCVRYSFSRDATVSTGFGMKSAPIQNEVMNRWFDREASRSAAGSWGARHDAPAAARRAVKPHLETHCDLGWQSQPMWSGHSSAPRVSTRRPATPGAQAQPRAAHTWVRPASADGLRPAGNMQNLTLAGGSPPMYSHDPRRQPPTSLATASRGPAYHTVAPASVRPNQRASPTSWAARIDNRHGSNEPRVGLAGNHGRLKSTWATQIWAQTLPPAGPPQPFLRPAKAESGMPAAGGVGCLGGIYTERRRTSFFGVT